MNTFGRRENLKQLHERSKQGWDMQNRQSLTSCSRG